MRAYTAATLAPFLEEVRASNLTPGSKVAAEQLAADAAALSAEVEALRTQLAQLQQQRSNETINQPSSKKPEWDKTNDPEPGKPRRKRKLEAAAGAPATGPRRIRRPIVVSITPWSNARIARRI